MLIEVYEKLFEILYSNPGTWSTEINEKLLNSGITLIKYSKETKTKENMEKFRLLEKFIPIAIGL